MTSRGRFTYLYSDDISYDGELYHLENTTTAFDYNHHYVCTSNNTNTCEKVRYYLNGNYYIELNGQMDIQSAIREMLVADDVNKYDSIMKTYIENWFANNLLNYQDYLEDPVFCNSREPEENIGESAWYPGGGTDLRLRMRINDGNVQQNLDCENIVDRFSVANEKAKLKYPIALLTREEIQLGKHISNLEKGRHYLSNNYANQYHIYTMTPFGFYNDFAGMMFSKEDTFYGSKTTNSGIVAPSISLKPGIKIKSGSGYIYNPYIIDLD